MRTNSIPAEVVPFEHEESATATSPYDYLGLFIQGVRRMAEIQKKAMELAYKQHLLLMENHKKTARKTRPGVLGWKTSRRCSSGRMIKQPIEQFVGGPQ